MLLSCVTGTYNRLGLLQRMAASVRADVAVGLDYELIVVDGGSTDGTLDWCWSQADVVLIEQGELRGAIHAFGAGCDAARGAYTLLLNDDVEIVTGSILRALVHLEETPACGMVAFMDDRPMPHKRGFDVDTMVMVLDGQQVIVPYGQIALVRTWLGHEIGWWGHRHPVMSLARTYGGDNFLSAGVWARGFSVDKVEGVMARDFVHEDGLRAVNRATWARDAALYRQAVATHPLTPSPNSGRGKLKINHREHRVHRGFEGGENRDRGTNAADFVSAAV